MGGEETRELKAETNKRLLASLNVGWNFESASRKLFQLFLERRAEHQTGPQPASMTFLYCCPQPIREHQILPPYRLATYPRTSSATLFLVPPPWSKVNVKCFKMIYTSPTIPNSLYKRSWGKSLQEVDTSFLLSCAAASSGRMARDLVLLFG